MKLVYLCHRIPFPPDKGDKIRSYHQVEYLATRHEVDLFTLVDDPADMAHVPALARMVRRVHAQPIHPTWSRARSLLGVLTGDALSVRYFRHAGLERALQHALATEAYDLAVVFSSNMAPYLDRWSGPRALDFVDVDSAKWLAYAGQLGPSPKRWLFRREGEAIRALEARLAEAAEVTVVCSEREEAELRRFCSPRNAVTVPNGTDVQYFSPGPTDHAPIDVIFTGAMDYRANADAVVWFADEVWPRIRPGRPEATFFVVGSNPAPAVARLSRLPGVTVTGRVDDVRPYLRAARVAIAPLRVARGIQNKVLEALACGRPVVATPAALGGIGDADGVLVADTPADFATEVTRLLEREDERVRLGASGRRFVESRFRWEIRLAELERRLLEAASSRVPG